jgi:GrpB-like predicted nucleotidyltransferase (UPF0157 family)
MSSNDEPVHVVPYDSDWPQRFVAERELLAAALGRWLVGPIEHVGSTAVPGLAAKPVIDIMAGVGTLDDSRPAIPVLERLQYCYSDYRSDVMHWLCKPSPARRTHHLHLVPFRSPLWVERVAFRDYLRGHAETALEYEHLKQQLAERFRFDREAYTDAKTNFISRVVKAALS